MAPRLFKIERYQVEYVLAECENDFMADADDLFNQYTEISVSEVNDLQPEDEGFYMYPIDPETGEHIKGQICGLWLKNKGR